MIQMNSVSFDYNPGAPADSALFEAFTLEIRDSEILVVMGPSGCGKTTLIRLIAGLLTPDAGSVLDDGAVVTGPSKARGVMFQGDTCFPWLTVRDNAGFAADNAHGVEGVDEVLRSFGLYDYRESFPRHLSFGSRQRVALARAIIAGAKTLLLDEPLNSVDPVLRRALQDQICSLVVTRGYAAVWVTHDLDEAVRVGHRIIVVAGQPLTIRSDTNVVALNQRDSGAIREDIKDILFQELKRVATKQ